VRKKQSLVQYARPEGDWRTGELPGLNLASVEGRLFSRYAKALVRDAGGADKLTTLKSALLHRATAICTILDGVEGRMLSNQPIDVVFYSLMVNTLVKLSRLVGIERIPRDVQDLDSYLASLQKGGNANGAAEIPIEGEIAASAAEALPRSPTAETPMTNTVQVTLGAVEFWDETWRPREILECLLSMPRRDQHFIAIDAGVRQW
jgi:hypothetical protein